jgi:hypothetical protein
MVELQENNMKRVLIFACLATACSLSHAAVINSTNATAIAAFQSGLNVVNFESIPGRTTTDISSYTTGGTVDDNSKIFSQLPGVQFSVGGQVGKDRPALFRLQNGISGDAHSPSTVLGPVDFDGTTKFGNGAMMELFFPAKVSKVGFWLNPSLGNVLLIAADTNFAFSGKTETTLETETVTAGNFVGIERPTADIGGFKIIGLGDKGFSIDDFSYGPVKAIPEPSTWAFVLAGVLALGFGLRRTA